ncbi:MAG: oligopeptide:H+ symporter, partial [Bryobacter sp.]|nr:oligopeptide:H+ symporter [Bryobacter sp.]
MIEGIPSRMAATTPDTRFFGHPAGLSTLFFTELWERFSYYGMRAILILYMTAAAAQGGLGFNVATAGAVYGLFTSSVYLTGLPGGWLADRFLGQRRAVLMGGLLIAAGNFLLMTASLAAFYGGLVLISFGTGLLKTNATTMVGLLYGQGDHRRDAGFSIYYMGINTGATVAPLAVGWVGQQVNFRLAFGLAGCGMLLGLLQYMLTAKRLDGAGLQPPSPAGAAQRRQLGWAAAILAALVGGAALLGVTVQMVADAFGLLLILVVLVTAGALLLAGDLSTVE